ncbi:MAG: polysaccharide biosynthesis/export family protein [Gemmatimonadaceae bacterium]
MRACLVGLLALSAEASMLHGQDAAATRVTLYPGDVIAVQIAAEKELTGQFVGDDRGGVVLPLLGARTVTGIPWGIARDSLLAAYARELRFPVVQLTPLRRVTVLGHVNLAGLHLLDPQVTIAGAIALAQGASLDGDLRRVRVVREGVTIVAEAPIEATVTTLGIRSGDQLFVGRRGWWDRNSGAVVGSLISAVALLVTVGR